MGGLSEAARRGESSTVLRLLDQGVDPNDRDSENLSALGWAIAKGLNDVVRAMLLCGADPDLSDPDGTTPLEIACKIGNIEVALSLIHAGANPNSKSEAHVTPLTAAAGQGASDIVRELLNIGADVNMPGRGGGTPLLYAAQDGHTEVVALLLAGGACPNIASNTGLTPLMQAARCANYEIVKLLLDHGALPDLQDNYESTARDMAAGEALLDHTRRVSLDRIQELLERHERINALPSERVERSLRGLVKAAKKELNAQPQPLVDTADKISGPSLDMQGALKEKPRDVEGEAAVEIVRNDPRRVNERLFGGGSSRLTALLYAILRDDKSLFEEALALGADIEVPDDYGSTPLMIATYNKRRGMAGILVERGADLRATSGVGKTVLHHAVMHGDLALAKAALDAGVKVDASDDEGYTPLHCAIVNNEAEAVDFLLAHGADPALTTSSAAKAGANKSAFDFANGIGKDAVAECLHVHKRGKWWKFWT